VGWDSLPHDYNGGGASERHNVWPDGANLYDLEGWGDIVLASRRAVGGILMPVAKVEILAPWITVALVAVAATVFATRRRKPKTTHLFFLNFSGNWRAVGEHTAE